MGKVVQSNHPLIQHKITLLRDKVSSYVDWYFIVIGLVLIVIVLFMPKGLLGFRRRLGFKQWRTTV